jgi:addiction module RelE/StbE family toxin
VPGPKISTIDLLPRFKRAYKKLDAQIQKGVDEAIQDLRKNPIPNSRRVHKMGGYDDVWEVRINRDYRMSFQLDGDKAILRNVDSHDELIDNP